MSRCGRPLRKADLLGARAVPDHHPARVRDSEQNEKYNAMVQAMKENGYCDHCCNVVLKYAANNLWKD